MTALRREEHKKLALSLLALYNPHTVAPLLTEEAEKTRFLVMLDTADIQPYLPVLLRGYTETFTATDSVELYCYIAHIPENQILIDYFCSFDSTLEYCPDLHLMTDILPDADWPHLMASMSAYIAFDGSNQDYLLKAMAMDTSILYMGHTPAPCFLTPLHAFMVGTNITHLKEAFRHIYQGQKKQSTRFLLAYKESHLSALNTPEFLQKMKHTEVAAIFYWGRSGSLFIQSLLDSHPEILTANGSNGAGLTGFYGSIWSFLVSKASSSIDEMIEQFCRITHKEHTGDSERYLFSSNFPLDTFKDVLKNIISVVLNNNEQFSRKWMFLAVHYAYAIAIGQDISAKHMIVYQAHAPDDYGSIGDLVNDFPTLKTIGTIRDPIRGFNSILAHQRDSARRGNKMGASHEPIPDYEYEDLVAEGIYSFYYRQMLMGWEYTQTLLPEPVYALKLEDLHAAPQRTMKHLAHWLGIQWHDCLLESTLDGVPFALDSGIHGPKAAVGFSLERTLYRSYKQQIGLIERSVLLGLLKETVERLGYQKISKLHRYLLPILIFFPTKLEQRSLWKALKQKNRKNIENTVLCILERYFFSYRRLFGKPLLRYEGKSIWLDQSQS